MQGGAANAKFGGLRNIYPLTLASLDLSPRRGEKIAFSLKEITTAYSRVFSMDFLDLYPLAWPMPGTPVSLCCAA